MISKNQLKRLCLIDVAIKILPLATRSNIQTYVQSKLDESLCKSSIEKDIQLMREEFDAPIKNWGGHWGGYFYKDENYEFYKSFLAYWDAHIDFPREIKSIIYD